MIYVDIDTRYVFTLFFNSSVVYGEGEFQFSNVEDFSKAAQEASVDDKKHPLILAYLREGAERVKKGETVIIHEKLDGPVVDIFVSTDDNEE